MRLDRLTIRGQEAIKSAVEITEKNKQQPSVMRSTLAMGRTALQKAKKNDWNTQLYELRLVL